MSRKSKLTDAQWEDVLHQVDVNGKEIAYSNVQWALDAHNKVGFRTYKSFLSSLKNQRSKRERQNTKALPVGGSQEGTTSGEGAAVASEDGQD